MFLELTEESSLNNKLMSIKTCIEQHTNIKRTKIDSEIDETIFFFFGNFQKSNFNFVELVLRWLLWSLSWKKYILETLYITLVVFEISKQQTVHHWTKTESNAEWTLENSMNTLRL